MMRRSAVVPYDWPKIVAPEVKFLRWMCRQI